MAVYVATAALLPALASAQYTRVTVSASGAQPDGPHGSGVISAAGTHVAFVSDATNLVAGDTNASSDIFLRDLQTNTTTRVSLTSEGAERPGASGPFGFDISNDARFVVFASRAPLSASDSAMCLLDGETTPANCPDIYLRDVQANVTTRISLPAAGGEANGASLRPRISGDGRWIVFESAASNLVSGDTNGVTDIFLFDRQTSTLTRVNLSTSGAQADLPSNVPSISDDGQVIAFVSAATILSGEPDPVVCERAPPACSRPFVHDRASGVTQRVAMPPYRTRLSYPGPPGIELVFRVTTSSVIVAPDGRTLAVNATSDPGFSTITTGPTSSTWVVDWREARIIRSIPSVPPGTSFFTSAWDGRRLAYATDRRSSVVQGTLYLAELDTGIEEVIAAISSLVPEAFLRNLSDDGRYLLYGTTERKTADDTDDALDFYVLDRDSDGDGLPSTWETRFGLDPANAADAGADPDGDGTTSLAEYGRNGHPTGGVFRYLAEGAANTFFSTRIALFNPGTAGTWAVVRQLGENQRWWSQAVRLNASTRITVRSQGLFDASFSTVIESSQPLVVDRTMTWDATGYGSHAETAVAAPATTWFLAEGATHGQFDLFYLLQNPGLAPATVTLTYLRPSPATPLTRSYVVGGESRLTIWVDNDPELSATDVSARVVSDQPILVERAMYMGVGTPPQPFGAGHAGAGVTAAAPRWFLAEGATGPFFDLYYLVANPSLQDTRIRVSYLLPASAPIVREYDVAHESRLTISVDTITGLDNTPVSAIVESLDNTGIVVERSMWWPGGGQWQEGHLAAGATTTGRRWALAEAEVASGTETYVLIANTSSTAGIATITIVPESGVAAEAHQVALPPNSRVNVPMSQYGVTANQRFSVIVDSDGPEIVVERAMYTNANGIVWAAGTAALATRMP